MSSLAEKDTIVVFIHKTVRAYLIDKGLVKIDPILEGNVLGRSHWSILELCLKVFEFSGSDELVVPEAAQEENDNWSFQHYVRCFWMKHGREGDAYIPLDFDFPRAILQCKGKGGKLINSTKASNEEEMFLLLAAEGCGQLTLKHAEKCRSVRSCFQAVGAVDDTSTQPQIFDRALFQAIINDRLQTVQRFRRHGVHKFNPNQIVANSSAIYKACYLGQHEIVQELLDIGANIAQPIKGRYKTALHAAAACNLGRVIDVIFSHPRTSTDSLLELRANISIVGRGATALHIAVAANSTNAAKVLLEHIDRSSLRETYHVLKTEDGKTAADIANIIAATGKNTDMKELLEEYLD
ncbi:hypothetical protein F5B21DRAFT_499992 [Xylaria acuta]|nr:hypothetical protein F5B21DRAFT_499992 [Xylaria acuta]